MEMVYAAHKTPFYAFILDFKKKVGTDIGFWVPTQKNLVWLSVFLTGFQSVSVWFWFENFLKVTSLYANTIHAIPILNVSFSF